MNEDDCDAESWLMEVETHQSFARCISCACVKDDPVGRSDGWAPHLPSARRTSEMVLTWTILRNGDAANGASVCHRGWQQGRGKCGELG